MTNGEKFKEIFKLSQVDDCDLNVYVWLPIHDAIEIPLEWWNAEYEEPTTKNDKVDCKHTDCNNCVNHKYCDYEPTTKNDLGVDCISREQALVAIRNLYPGMPRVDFNGSLRKWVDKYKPYIECDDAIKQLPSVTPQPRKGHWIKHDNGVWWECSKCHAERAYGNEYCPDCGSHNGDIAKMVEPQESEE